MSDFKAFICGISGPALTEEERIFIQHHHPWGFILFSRNIVEQKQLHALVEELHRLSGPERSMIFIDQEGGRVQRLRPPFVPDYPSASQLGMLYQQDKIKGLRATWLMSRLHAFDLSHYGINANCLPVLDLPVSGSHEIIGSRAYATCWQSVVELGQMAAFGLRDGGVLPVMKHIPGHGRAFSDTHETQTIVDASEAQLWASDFIPFQKLATLPCAMTAHIIYSAIDPENPATFSQKLIGDTIRKTIGFDGLLMSDDLSMKALSGDIASRAVKALASGCDVALHANGELSEMLAIAESVPYLSGQALRRAQQAQIWALDAMKRDKLHDETKLRAEFLSLTASFAN